MALVLQQAVDKWSELPPGFPRCGNFPSDDDIYSEGHGRYNAQETSTPSGIADGNSKALFSSTNESESCVDRDSDCMYYNHTMICSNGSRFQPWAEVHCRAYCGFCYVPPTQIPCINAANNCDEYGDDLCTNPLYRIFSEKNCRKFCQLCTDNDTLPAHAQTTVMTTTQEGNCTDRNVDCNLYNHDKICSNESIYYPWAQKNCPAYCGFCDAPPVYLPCIDVLDNCNEYGDDLCTNPMFRIFREDNCRKFCQLCVNETYIQPQIENVTQTTNDTTGQKGPCTDMNTNCRYYNHTMICSNGSRFQPWAEVHCAAYCGFCEAPPKYLPCIDVIENCEEYGDDLCTNPMFRIFVEDNCRKYCQMCSNETQTRPIQPTTAPEAKCTDLDSDCRYYNHNLVCSNGSRFQPWARVHCPAYCGFCEAPPKYQPCIDVLDYCDEFGDDLCTNPSFRIFREDNCRKYCHLCTNDTQTTNETYVQTQTTQNTTRHEGNCTDLDSNCNFYNHTLICSNGSRFEPWAREHCPAYCGFCEAPDVYIPCVDQLDNCDEFGDDLCTEPLYRIFREKNCRKFCKLCVDNSTDTTDKCIDLDSDCRYYNYDMICSNGSRFQPWARHHCPAYCGFCDAPPKYLPCIDMLDNCDEFGDDLCTNPLFRIFREDNCRKYCQLCTNDTQTTNETYVQTAQNTTGNEVNCTDLDSNCNFYNHTLICSNGSRFQPWARDHCPVYCGFCEALYVYIPCVDQLDYCDEFGDDLCTEPLYRIFREKNCRKFCKICTDNSTDIASTPSTISTTYHFEGNCTDRDWDCRYYNHTLICSEGSRFQPWARYHCPAYCGFCEAPTKYLPCIDVIKNCDEYADDMCTNPIYRIFREDNCRKFCQLCTNDTYIQTETTNNTLGKEGNCTDFDSNCNYYNFTAICSNGSRFEPWAREFCPAYCGYCEAPFSNIPCVDQLDYCDEFGGDLCTNPLYRIFREKNCRKYCNLCEGNSTDMIGSCTDLDSDCRYYNHTLICSDGSRFQPWARLHCPAYCGFCKAPPKHLPCIDVSNHCEEFGDDLCTNPTFRIFREDNCRKFCQLCTNETLTINETYVQTSQNTTGNEGNCTDLDSDCNFYNHTLICSNGSRFQPWAREHCPAYCGFCEAPSIDLPCVDELTYCDEFVNDICTDPYYRIFRENNCRKFCKLCTDNSTDTTDVRTTPKTISATTRFQGKCVDLDSNCNDYNTSLICSKGSQFYSWARQHCPAYCGFCHAPPTHIPCIDRINNCHEYTDDICTDPQYRHFTESNCRKHCGWCS